MTPLALVLAPVASAVTLLVSGWAKRSDTTATREAFVALGLPRRLNRVGIARALPAGELGLGVLLLVTWGRPLVVVGVVVTALFATYTVLVARVLRRGEAVECHCFGALGDDRVTVRTLGRNLVLVVLAVLATGFGATGGGLVTTVTDLDGADWWWPVMAALVATAAVLVVSPGRSAETADLDDQRDYVRQPIPFGVLVDAAGATVSLRALAVARPQLLVFLSPGCGSCHLVAEWLPGWARRLAVVDVSAVFGTPLDAVPDDMRPEGVALRQDPDSAVSHMFATGRPSAVLLGADGLLAGGPVVGPRDLGAFVEDIIDELAAQRSAPTDPTTDPATDPHLASADDLGDRPHG